MFANMVDQKNSLSQGIPEQRVGNWGSSNIFWKSAKPKNKKMRSPKYANIIKS